ncbi:MAG: DNA polymerase III subunit gamma/tau, partial [Eggerthellaceae bacterium]|nr:DNA polymerase III subunit gamma/tau [Eggerthellaceae bacterium]
MAEALYRKYRPQIFEDVVGQEHIERTLKNAIEQDKVSHAYLFCGPRGTGKTTTARLLAKALLCQRGPTSEPDGTCEDCEMIAAGEHPDVYELDAASRTGVENVREEIIGRVQFAPTRGRYKIYIIDEVHMLSTAAFNALLKTLEEPPSHVVFILATTDPQKVPETIHSRCQRFDFRRISNEAIVSRLGAICVAEGVEFEGDALDLIAHRAEGGMRNALTSLEQLIAFGEGRVTMEVAERMLGSLAVSELGEIVRFVGTRDVASCFRWTAEYVETGADLAQFTRDFAEHIRNMYVMSLAGVDVALDVSESVRRELAEELPLFGPDRLARLLGVLGDLSAELKSSTNPRLTFEIALTRMVRPDSDLTLEALAERVEALESGYSAVAHVVSTPASVGAAAHGAEAANTAGALGAGVATRAVAGDARAKNVDAQAAAASATVAPAESRAEASPVAPASSQPVSQERPQANQPISQVNQVVSQESRAAEQAGQAPAQASRPAAQPAQAAFRAEAYAASSGSIPAQLAESLQNPAALQRAWQAALATLKKAKAAYGVLFLNTKASFDAAEGSIIVDFPAENDFAYKAVQKADVQSELAAALAQACGAPVPFRLTKAGAGRGSAPAPHEPQQQPVERHQQPAAQQQQPAAQSQQQSAVQPQQQPAAQPQFQHTEVAAPEPQVDATTQATPPAPYETPTGYAGFEDAVPLDVYDDMVPYDEYGESASWEPASPSAAPATPGTPSAEPANPASRTT